MSKQTDAKEKQAKVISVSLFPGDLKHMDAIAEFIRKKAGARINNSQAVRLALRSAPLGDALLQAWETVVAEDGRKRKA